jgi:hypothetical protein
MKLIRNSLAIVLNVTLVSATFLSFAIQSAPAQDSRIALQRGYRTGYSDGYMAGYRDSTQNAERSIQNHSEYNKADRAYSKSYGTLEDYRDGYQQGFESGYNTGFEKRSFDSTLPIEIQKRGTAAAVTPPAVTPGETANTNNTNETSGTAAASPTGPTTTETAAGAPTLTTPTQTTEAVTQAPVMATLDGQVIVIPAETELIIELLGPVTTSENKNGDKFQAKVVSPYEISGAIIDGRVDKVTKPGRIKRRAELQLSFDQIRLTNERWSNFNALLTEVLPVQGDNVKKVDNEGSAIGKSSIKPDAVKVGASTGTGLVVGAIVAGPVGAGVGAAMGAAFGVGAVVVERGKHIKLIKGQQLRIRTVYETQIR